MAAEERRQFTRRESALHATVRTMNAITGLNILTRDVGAGGACLLSPVRLNFGSVFHSDIQVPGQPRPISFTGRVVWTDPLVRFSAPEPHAELFEIGCEFLDISPEAQATIAQHASEHESTFAAEL